MTFGEFVLGILKQERAEACCNNSAVTWQVLRGLGRVFLPLCTENLAGPVQTAAHLRQECRAVPPMGTAKSQGKTLAFLFLWKLTATCLSSLIKRMRT